MGYWEGVSYANGLKGAGCIPRVCRKSHERKSFGREVAGRRAPLHLSYQRPTITLPTPYHRRTIVAASSDFSAKSEDAVKLVRRWYGVGVAMVRRSLERRAARHGLPAMPDCRGGVFAVFAKIPPPSSHPPSPSCVYPCPSLPALRLSMVGAVAFVATWRAALRLRGTASLSRYASRRDSGCAMQDFESDVFLMAFVATWRAASRLKACRVAIKGSALCS